MSDYRDASLPVDQRVEDLLARMTLKEKIGQLNQKMFGWDVYEPENGKFRLSDAWRQEVAFGDGVGALYGLFRADPWSGADLNTGISVEESARFANELQRYVIENTRLGIPVLLSEECPHGHQAIDGTILPTNLGIGSTWNPDLYEEAYGLVASEIRARGAHLGLISCLDILRDGRWGRSEECYGEDPVLASRMVEAVVRGLQGTTLDDLQRPDKVVAVLKHFCAQGAAVGGHNAWPAAIGERELREVHLSGMQAGIRAGALGCMAAYNEIDGIPCHANPWLLTSVLRDEMAFQGLVMSDGTAVDRLIGMAGDHASAAAVAVKAGVDLNLWNQSFLHLQQAVESGVIDEGTIDQAVRRVLRTKFLLGLFERPYADEFRAVQVVGSQAIQEKNLQLARESLVLLKNGGGLLPLRRDLRRIAVIGPNADAIYNQLGDYTPPQRPGVGVTCLQGIQSMVSPQTEVRYSRGCGIRDHSTEGFEEAVKAARDADVAIVVIGGSSSRYQNTEFASNGAAVIDSAGPSEMDCGEGVDVANLELGGVQVSLVRELMATGTPVVVVLLQGRPHAVPWLAENCEAILCAWYPGQQGGLAIAEALFGEVNPSGKLPVSIPVSSAQLPVYYNRKDTDATTYVDMQSDPLYPFGYGLSYTSFVYSNLRVEPPTSESTATAGVGIPSEVHASLGIDALESGQFISVHVDVENSGMVAGQEVVQLYIRDLEASITRRVRELKGFVKVHLEAGERKTVSFQLHYDDFAIWTAGMRRRVEPGLVQVFVGGDSTTTTGVTVKLLDAST